MDTQKDLNEITKAVDGEFTRLQLVENIHTSDQEYKQWGAKRKRFRWLLATSLIEEGVTEATVGEEVVTIDHKMLASFDRPTLSALARCTTDDQRILVMKGIPSGKQLKELQNIAGAAAKAVIESARRKIETDTIIVKIKKPKKIKAGRRR